MADIGYKLEIGKYMLYGKSLDCKHGSLQTDVCYNKEILINNAADHKQICVIYETVYFCIWGGGIWCNLVYPPGLKRMNFTLTVIDLHVCYNQEILVNIADDHKQRCIYI